MPSPDAKSQNAVTSGRLLALVPQSFDRAALRDIEEIGIATVLTENLSECLKQLGTGNWLATLVSLSSELVDEPVVQRIARAPGCGGLLLSARGASLERALLAERVGAMGLLREPIDPRDLLTRVSLLLDEGPEIPFTDGPPPARSDQADPTLIGEGPAMAGVFERIARVARSDSTVLLTGESGTGKEVVARALHAASARRDGAFVAVNCAAIPEQLLESELFGHEKGAFTGAVGSRIGRFERANGGSLLLDEIGDMSLLLQSKLLRALEERQVEPVGGTAPRAIDVRVIAATHRDLAARIEDGRFREDLFYRLAVVDISLPALRERGPDVRPLALHFGATFAKRHDRPVRAVTERALERLAEHSWPGNVRELRNVMERAVLLAGGPVIRAGHLRLGEAAPRASSRPSRNHAGGYPASFSLADVEAAHIARVLASTDAHIGRAADILSIHRNTLTRKLQQYGLDSADAESDREA
ncbi:MAG: sigma-54 dependent transcriptional regulator [Gemmatimonadota bacterium]